MCSPGAGRLRQGNRLRRRPRRHGPALGRAGRLHLVDLDGARHGQPVNGASVRAIVAAAGVPCQLGGGLRTEAHLAEALGWGVARVILGTRALQDADWCAAMCQRFPGQVALGIDARGGRVASDGWLRDSDILAVDLARQAAAWGVAAIIYTDIHRDGMLQGANVEATAELARAVPGVPVIASGGVSSLDDIVRLAATGVAGCIIGRALYEGRIDLRQAIAMTRFPGGPILKEGGMTATPPDQG
jgi:phosphoribosylformimino-5-aminoimidazole carboxamide ribotide isomerase